MTKLKSTLVLGLMSLSTPAFWMTPAFGQATEAGYAQTRPLISAEGSEGFGSAQEVEGLVYRARNGDVHAQYRLARSYEFGRGTRKDYVEAARWYAHAAQRGLAVAQFKLGLLYERGQGVKKDFSYALSWYEEAARNGLAPAMKHLQNLTSAN